MREHLAGLGTLRVHVGALRALQLPHRAPARVGGGRERQVSEATHRRASRAAGKHTTHRCTHLLTSNLP